MKPTLHVLLAACARSGVAVARMSCVTKIQFCTYFSAKISEFWAPFSLKTIVESFVLRLLCYFLLLWVLLAQNFDLPPQFRAERKFPHPNGGNKLVRLLLT